jgi:hypothetical protein
VKLAKPRRKEEKKKRKRRRKEKEEWKNNPQFRNSRISVFVVLVLLL